MTSRIAVAVVAAMSFGALAFSAQTAVAQSADSLVRSLIVSPERMTPDTVRKLVVGRNAAGFSTERLRTMANRPVVAEERREIAAAVAANQMPSVDMEVYFAYDSTAILPDAYPSLYSLGQALSDPRLAGQTFLIGGHTDASGSNAYNQALSESRAWSIKQFLVANFAIAPQSLVAVGFGEEDLKNPFDPNSGVNRRVQIVNLATR